MKKTSPISFSTILEALAFRAEHSPDSLAFAVEGEEITYGALFADVREVASGLSQCGLARYDRCVLLLPTSIDFIRSLFAIQLIGAAPVALNTTLPPQTLLRRIAALRARLAVCPEEMQPILEQTARQEGVSVGIETPRDIRSASPGPFRPASLPSPEDIAYLQVTSGTTGEPKSAILLHRNLIACLNANTRRFGSEPDDVFVSWVPLHHDMGLVRFLFLPLFLGKPAHLLHPAITNFPSWLETIDRVRGTITSGPDFSYRIAARIVDPTGLDLSSLRQAINGGEPVRISTIEMFEDRFDVHGVIRPGYGLAEATLGVSSLGPKEALCLDDAGNVSCGRPMPGTEVRIVDEQGSALPPQRSGEIQVRSPQVFQGYLDDPEASRQALRDGWLTTGDVGHLDRDGHLYVLGREREMIKRAGATIAPREIEEAVDQIHGVRLSAAIGHVSERLGGSEELVVIAEVRDKEVHGDDQLASLAEAIVDEVVGTIGHSPGDVVLVVPRTIPRTDNGKIKRAELGRLFEDGKLAQRRAILLGARE